MLCEPGAGGRTPDDEDVLARVAIRLRSIAGPLASDPLHVIPMRGGLTLGRPPNPAQPSVIVSTIPMYGSRLLFRGFGSSRSMRPIDAALAGADSLVLVDEAHLAQHLRALIPNLQECIPQSARALLPASRSAPQVVSLTATGDASPDGRFELDEDDLENEVVRERLDASKPIEVDAEPRGDSAKALRDAAVRLLSGAGSPASCVVFCNTPAVARSVHGLIMSNRLGTEADLFLVTGRTRQADADALRKRLLSPTLGAPATRAANGDPPERDRHLIVVATQTLEVGADLDFEFLVTEQCGVRALTQRLGRLNRLGRHPKARAVYVHRPPPKRPRSSSTRNEDTDDGSADDGWPVYGAEPTLVLERLDSRGFDDHIDLSPRVIADRLGEPADDPGRAPEVLPGLLWEWVKTTSPPHGAAPVEPYFSGISEPQRSVSVVWRAYVPNDDKPTHGASVDDEAEEREAPHERLRLWPRVSHDEIAEVPLHELRRTLRERGVEKVVRRLQDRSFFEVVRRGDLQPGDLVVLPIDGGLYDEFGWAPDATRTVNDLSIRQHGLPLDRSALKRLLDGDLRAEEETALDQALGKGQEDPDGLGEIDEDRAREGAERLVSLLGELHDDPPFGPDAWREFLARLKDAIHEGAGLVSPENEIPRIELEPPTGSARIDEFDEMSRLRLLPPEAMKLVAHGNAVGKRARQLAGALGLPTALADVIERAGSFHDIGKADERFQRWLNPRGRPDETGYVPLAKSDMPASRWSMARRDARWPIGGRHEELSARLVLAWLASGADGLDANDQDLLVHLVVSHHGNGRPLVPPVADDSTAPVAWRFADGARVSVPADLSKTDWDQPARFRRLNEEYGPWGVALLEAVVRQADHEVSAGADDPAAAPNDTTYEVQ